MKKFFAILGVVLLVSTAAFAVGENAGDINSSSLGSENWDSPSLGQMKTVYVAVKISGGSDGCQAYDVQLWGDNAAGSDRELYKQHGSSLAAGEARRHVFAVDVKRNKIRIGGHAIWGPDAQYPINISLLRLAPIRYIAVPLAR